MSKKEIIPNRVIVGSLIGLPSEALACEVMAKHRNMTMADWLRWCVTQAESFQWNTQRAGTEARSLLREQLMILTPEAITRLTEQEWRALSLRFGLDENPLTLQAAGDRMGVTRERVRQLVNHALAKLSDYLR